MQWLDLLSEGLVRIHRVLLVDFSSLHLDTLEHFSSTTHHPHRGLLLPTQLEQSMLAEHSSKGSPTTWIEQETRIYMYADMYITYLGLCGSHDVVQTTVPP